MSPSDTYDPEFAELGHDAAQTHDATPGRGAAQGTASADIFARGGRLLTDHSSKGGVRTEDRSPVS